MHAPTKIEPKCRICQLVQTHPTLFTELHKHYFDVDPSKAATLRWLNRRVAVLNQELDESEQLSPFNAIGLRNHGDKHVQSYVASIRVVRGDSSSESDVNVLDLATSHFEPVRSVSIPEPTAALREYAELQDLVVSNQRRLLEYEKKNHKDGEVLSLDDLSEFQKLTRDLMVMRRDLAAITKTEAVAGDAVRDALESTIEGVLGKVEEVTAEVKHLLQAEMPSSTIPAEVEKLFRARIGETLNSLLPLVIKVVFKKYGIK